MEKAAAWSVRGVGRETRDAAQDAARRAGMSLGEWLDDLIAEKAAEQGVDPQDLNQEERLDAIGERLSGLPRRDDSAPRRPREAEAQPAPPAAPLASMPPAAPVAPREAMRAEELLDKAIARFDSRAAKSEARTARALDSVATWIERSQTRQHDEQETLRTVVGRLASLEERIAAQQAARGSALARPAPRPEPPPEGPRDLAERVNDLARRLESFDRGGREALRAVRPRLDISEAVSQIARRRQELDARAAGGEAEVRRPPGPGEAAAGREAAPLARESPANNLQNEIGKLSQRLDGLRRDHSERREPPGGAGIEGLRLELAAMSRSLADLAPRNAVVALEGAIRDLSQRVAASRDNGARESVLAPIEGLIGEFRESLRAHDPRAAVEALQREIAAIGSKMEGVARASINPAALERIRQQTEEARNLLATLAQRPAPLDRLEKQIGDLADRVDRLPVSLAPHADSAQLIASLAEARAQLERSTPASALSSIERRLEQIAAKMDEALQRPAAMPSLAPRALEELSRRIDGVRETIESRYAAAPGAPIDSKPLEEMIRDLGARIDRRTNPVIDTAPLEQVLRRLGDRPVAVDTRPLEGLMREIGAKLESAQSGAQGTELLENLRDINAKLESARAAAPDAGLLERLLRDIDDKLDGSRSAPDSETLERLLRDIDAKLDSPRFAADTERLERLLRDISARLETSRAAAPDIELLEHLLRDISAKLDSPRDGLLEDALRDISVRLEDARAAAANGETLENLLHEINAKLDRPPPSTIEPAALEAMIRDLAARIDKRTNPIIDTRALEQTLRTLQDRIELSASPQFAAERIDQAVQILSERFAAQNAAAPDINALGELIRGLEQKLENANAGADPQALQALAEEVASVRRRLEAPPSETGSTGALERMIGQLSAQLDQTRQTLDRVSPSGASDEELARELAELRAEQNNSDHRLQATLGGVHHMLESLVDRMGQLEDDVAQGDYKPREPAGAAPPRAADTPAAAPAAGPSAALNWMDATLRDAPPAKPAADDRDASFDAPLNRGAATSPMRSLDGSDFLIEPGAGAPMRPRDKDQATSAKSGVNAHIAAARRAAQAALAETASNVARPAEKAPGPDAGKALRPLGAFLKAQRRPLLLGAALVALIAIAVVELGVLRQPAMQRSEATPPAARFAAATPAKLSDAARVIAAPAAASAKSAARAIDPTPVGSIGAPAAAAPAKFLTPAPSDLVAAIPAAVSPNLRETAASGDPAAEFELGARLADGRNLPRDSHAGAQWLALAAAHGLPPAEYRLGTLYEKGIGVTRDATIAKSWYKKAGEAGNARAMHNLAVLIAEGPGAKPDYPEAAEWFRKAARLGVKDSQYNLAILYARGLGVMQDLGQSWFWFSLAARQGDIDAARKRDEVAAKMDAAALAADETLLADFHLSAPEAAANEVAPPPGGWDVARVVTPQPASRPPQSSPAPAAATHSSAL
jgi:localization factor PodJL